jgi:hypothetical protein
MTMTKRLIYLDTSIWNVLAEQAADAASAYKPFSERGVEITLGLNAYFEMLKSFYGKRPDALSRGRKLFGCVDQYLGSGVRFVKTWEELLIQESKKILGIAASTDPFCAEGWQHMLRSAARDLASGDPHLGTRELMLKRDAHSDAVRNLASQNISCQAEMMSDLRSVHRSDLGDFLDQQIQGSSGRQLLAKYLSQIFPMFKEQFPIAADELAVRLLESKSNRVAHAIVRSDIYQNWRAAGRESGAVRPSVPDDSYHVVNASYCDMFITEDQDGQADAASHALAGVRALVYRDRQIPFFNWLDEQEQVGLGLEFMKEYRDTFRTLAN